MFKDFDIKYKIVIVGNSGVGKTALLCRFVDDNFKNDILSTIGVDFKFKSLFHKNKKVKLQIWDTAGQQVFRTIVGAYYKKANAIFLVFDLTQQKSFSQIQQFWLKQVLQNCQTDSILILIGNKCDLEDISVTKEQITQFMERANIQFYFQTSAKLGYEVDKAFYSCLDVMMERIVKKPEKNDEITLQQPKPNENMQQVLEMKQEIKVKKKKQKIKCKC